MESMGNYWHKKRFSDDKKVRSFTRCDAPILFSSLESASEWFQRLIRKDDSLIGFNNH